MTKSRARNATPQPHLGWLQPRIQRAHPLLTARIVNIPYLLDYYWNTTALAVTLRCYRAGFGFTKLFPILGARLDNLLRAICSPPGVAQPFYFP